MISRCLLIACLVTIAQPAILTADESNMPTAREMLKARLAEEAKQNAAKPAMPPAPKSAATPSKTSPVTQAPADEKNPIVASPGPAVETAGTTDQAAKAKRDPATVLPKVEVRKGRITVLDQQLAKQEQDIAREKKNTKPGELDKILNDSSIAKPLSILGGESAQFRQRVASERVGLMEDEKDLIEAIAHAKTKEEKAELKKQLDVLRAERRELEKALR